MPLSEEEQQKLEEARRKAEEEESHRLEEEVARRSEALRKLRQKKKEEEEARQKAEQERKRREEEARRKAEEEQRRKDEEERKQREEAKKRAEEEARRKAEEEEARRKAEEEQRRKDEEERKQREEAKKRAEEEARRKAEEEERKRREEEETRRKAEEEERRRREEAERRHREEDNRRRREEEGRRKREEEERQRLIQSLKNAEAYLIQNEFDKALAEVESILSADPMHAEALALDEKIRAARAAHEAKTAAAEVQPDETVVETPPQPPVEKAVPKPKKEKALPAKKPLPMGVIIGTIATIVVVVVGFIIYQLTHTLFEGKQYIAVLPFTSQSNTDEERTLGTALAEETAALLSYIPNARIMGPSTAVNLHRRTRNPRARAHKLNFAHTMSGTISLAGNNVVLSVEIVDTLGNKMWTGHIEKSRDRLMELPAELTTTVAEAFSLSLPEEIESFLTQAPTTKSNAYIAYLRGRELLHHGTYASINSALNLFQQAAIQDPNFAEAYAAAAHSLFNTYESGLDNGERLLSRAETLAKKALAIRPSLAEAHVVIGGIAELQKKYSVALTSLQRALELMPSNTEALRLLGIVYAINGNEDKALEHINRSYELDPANTDLLTSAALINQRFGKPREAMAYFNRALPFVIDTSTYLAVVAGNTLISAYQYDHAIALYEQRVEFDSRNYIDQYKLARAYQLAGKGSAVWSNAFEKTIALIQQELQLQPQNALATAYLGLALSRYGRYQEGEENGKRALQLAPNDLIIKYKLANIYSIQKKKTEAIRALRDAIKMRYMLEEIVNLDLYNISEEPEFLQTISLPLE